MMYFPIDKKRKRTIPLCLLMATANIGINSVSPDTAEARFSDLTIADMNQLGSLNQEEKYFVYVIGLVRH